MLQRECETVAQFKVYEWIRNNFHIENLQVIAVDKQCLKITDKNNESMLVTYENRMIHTEFL
ncbi:hypothetical protein MKD14_08860 [[Clostridium] innocuum]|nr:hypothetical protein [[Clostridium] innocuum]